LINSNNNIEEILSDLEGKLNIKFKGNKQIQVMEYIAILNFKKIGVTVKKLISQFNYKKDYAEKVLHGLKSRGIVKASGIREGHMKTYFLSNMQDYIPLPEDLDINKENLSDHKEKYDIDQDMIMTLCKMITNNPGGFHDIRLQTRLICKEDYDRLTLHGESRWYIKSD
jgi:hypothetical protein